MYYFNNYIIISIYGNVFIIIILPKFLITKNFQKVFWIFDFGHLFLSIFEKPKYFLKKGI